MLVGNYAPDRQLSMRLFCDTLHDGLAARGVAVERLLPEPRLGRWRAARGELAKWLGHADKFILFPRTLRKKIARLRAAHGDHLLVHICDHSNAMYAREARDVPHLVTCHDVIAIRAALGHFPFVAVRFTGRRLQRMILHGLRQAKQLVCDSTETRRQLLALGGFAEQQVHQCYVGLNQPYRPMAEAERQSVFQADPALRGLVGLRYVFHVGGNQWYKNREGVLRIYAAFVRREPDGPDLVLAGKPLPSELTALLHAEGIADRVHHIGEVLVPSLNALYAGAECLLFPSHVEGFGWPVLEAMAVGCPVLASHRAPLTEIGGEAAAYLNPDQVADAASRLSGLLCESASARASRRTAGLVQAEKFSTAAMLDGYLALYRQLGPTH